MSWIKQLPAEEFVLSGMTSCVGCGAALSLRIALKILGGRTVLVVPACCTSIIQGAYPKTAFKVPVLNVAFASAPAVASGVAAALKVRGIEDVNVVVWAGDGATADIGLASLSGAAYRGENILYICYDNEGYMNTGVQDSGATPLGARTMTSPAGKILFKKNIPLIMMEHRIPYVATASVSYPHDFVQKIQKASNIKGFKYVHLLTPCPPGWRMPADETVNVGRLAVETGAWVLFEIENSRFSLTGPSVNILEQGKRKSITEYLKVQERYKRMTDETIKMLQEGIDESLKKYVELQKAQ